MEAFIDPTIRCPGPDSIHPDATIIESRTHTGRICRIIDNTRSIDRAELSSVLETLIQEKRFGVAALSAHGSGVLSIGHPDSTHIQFGDTLYRLLLFPYEARIELF